MLMVVMENRLCVDERDTIGSVYFTWKHACFIYPVMIIISGKCQCNHKLISWLLLHITQTSTMLIKVLQDTVISHIIKGQYIPMDGGALSFKRTIFLLSL